MIKAKQHDPEAMAAPADDALPGGWRRSGRDQDGGYYSVYTNAEKLDRNWRFHMPSHYAELKFISHHAEGIESYSGSGQRQRRRRPHHRLRVLHAPWITAEGT